MIPFGSRRIARFLARATKRGQPFGRPLVRLSLLYPFLPGFQVCFLYGLHLGYLRDLGDEFHGY